ncbi:MULTISPECIES: gamma-glutamyl-gamma-aminobutyrate hydrolase family protein [unclassified Mycolicibacterium]|uniref:gamma-glutamyl-gamma-aminobutyrate hydrolase family protein n=1 Tax=unclassified Mycolicibacterium TaxID=2636767 RepID=UPI002EDAC2C8
MSRPFIAVPAIRSPKIAGLRRSGVVAADKICDAIFRAGGDPFLLPPGDLIGERLCYADGAVIPGGADLDPATYGQDRDERTESSDTVQDAYDLAFAAALLDLQIPFLAICRGMQVLNVALGGSLTQHLTETTVPHRNSMHQVNLTPGCATAVAMGGHQFEVSSYHHQAIDRLGAGLRVAGRAVDGCIEVIEHTNAPVLAVQWHPEDDAESAAHQQGLFNSVIAAARDRRRHGVPSSTALADALR